MKFAVLASKKDIAGMNIARKLENLGVQANIIDEDNIYAENIDEKLDANFILFASKHQSKEHTKTLSVHVPGNWTKAELGGMTGKACQTSALFFKHIFQILNKNAESSGYLCTLECTHHGPYLQVPCCFIEIGSGIGEWQDEKAAEIIARTINEAIKSFDYDEANKKFKSAIGIGGLHYCPNFNKIQLNSEYALGHIIPKYSLPLTPEILEEALNKTIEKPKIIILDWKGLGKSEQRQAVMKILSGFEVIRTSDVEK